MSAPLVIDQADPEDSLFAEQYNGTSSANRQDVPWWQKYEFDKNFLLQPQAFVNAWNGVFPTVVVNIFGIVIFLRMGWIVGTAGVFDSILIILLCTFFSGITVLSAVGICERCQIKEGGVYFIISHVLGKRIGGSIGIIYTFGQAIATSLVALGFGESMARLFGIFSPATAKFFAAIVLIILNALNFAGLRFIIRLQLLLLCFLGVAIVDFLFGSLFMHDPDYGIDYMNRERLSANWEPHYSGANCTMINQDSVVNGAVAAGDVSAVKAQDFFSVFGVLFANFIGVLAGVNMSTNLRNPLRDIAEGELSALGVSCALCILFALILGAGVQRDTLLCDFMVSERISLTKLLFLSGLYVSCLSSILSSTLGTSRVVLGIAAEGFVPWLNAIAEECSSDRNPLKATVLVTVVSVFFVFVGSLNQLAILSAVPFLVTYAFVNYAYVSLAMSDDLTNLNEEIGIKTSYGSVHNFEKVSDTLNQLFPAERDAAAASGSGARTQGGGAAPHASDAPPRQFGLLGADCGVAKPWYTMCINRYISFAAAIVHILMVIFINKWFALFHLLAFLLLYLNLGTTSTSFEQGVSQFSIVHMIQVAMQRENLDAATLGGGQHVAVVPPAGGPVAAGVAEYRTSQLNQANQDYSARKQYHHAEQVGQID